MSSQTDQPRTAEAGTLRNRSFGGCGTCRGRHVKCDEGRPICSMCRYGGLDCAGYEKGIFFDCGDSTITAGEGATRFRRPILTEEERKRMSQRLVSIVPPGSVLHVLARIDDQSESSSFHQHTEVHQGPFGAFMVKRAACVASSDPGVDPWPEERIFELDLARPTNDLLCSSESALWPWNQDLPQGIFNESNLVPSLASPNSWNVATDWGCIQEVFDDDFAINDSRDAITNSFSMQNILSEHYIPAAALSQPTVSPALHSFTATHDGVPPDATSLLKHYTTTVITLLTPLRHSKTPWHILFLPHIKQCLAALTLGEQPDHASLVAFYGSLAISAVSLGGVSNSQMWRDRGKSFNHLARKHARLMLKTAYDVPKVAKYKAILMALLTMVQLSMFVGTREQTDCHLVEVEKFIRLKGLNRKKSRKVRLLHHCYAFERLFHESIFIDSTDSQQRNQVQKAIESSGLAIHSRDSLSFRLPQFQNLDDEMLKVKSQEVGENDLHLGCLGEFPPTLYPEIFGVPESWLLLLSLTIRLGKEKDSAEVGNSSKISSLKSFMTRAKAIERRIHRLRRHEIESTSASSSLQSQTDLVVLNSMLDAVHQALLIYFYQRIYDVEASMLQQKVIGVRDCLLRCEYADPSVVHGSIGFIWPAFMAACEAEDPEVQVSFSLWFKTSAQSSGLSCFTDTLEIIEQIWREKRPSSLRSVTWLDIMKRKKSLPEQPI